MVIRLLEVIYRLHIVFVNFDIPVDEMSMKRCAVQWIHDGHLDVVAPLYSV